MLESMASERRGETVLALALALTSCSAPGPAQADLAPESAAFPGADGVLAGFDPTEAGAAWRARDRVLFALSTEAGARTQRKLVEIELVGPSTVRSSSGSVPVLLETTRLTTQVGDRSVSWSSQLLSVAVRVYEPDGRLVQHTQAKVPETVLRTGIHPALVLSAEWVALEEAGAAQEVEPTEQDLHLFCEAVVMLPTLLGILQGDSVL